ncbi:MAG: T9SS type A sorting domain-containing protein [Rhodothermales bacterium]|nr:T9SS type A sorting domain-containing protein [Rhodothermales bacterium]
MRFATLSLFAAVLALALPARAQDVVFDSFDDGDVTDVFPFSETTMGIGVGTAEGEDGAADAALSVGLNPAETGSFAGVNITGGAGSVDVSAAAYMTFYLRTTGVDPANLPLTLELNLHEDANGNGEFDGPDEEYQAVYRVEPSGGYDFVAVPLAAFADDNAVFPGADDGFDFGSLLEFVIAIGGPQGPEFNFQIDEIAFSVPGTVASEPGAGDAVQQALSVFPNPAVGTATVAFTLDEPAPVRVEAFDVLGRRVAVLADGPAPAGESRVGFEVGALPAGLYLVRVSGAGQTQVRPVTVTR